MIVKQAVLAGLRVAHFIAQNARHQTDTDLLDRHISLIPRALAVQTDVLDRSLCVSIPPSSTRESIMQSFGNPLLFVFEDQRGPVANHAFNTGDAIQHQVTQAVGIGDAHVDD